MKRKFREKSSSSAKFFFPLHRPINPRRKFAIRLAVKIGDILQDDSRVTLPLFPDENVKK